MDELQIVSYCRLQDLCTKLKKMSKEEKDRLHIRDDLVTGESEVECFIDEMNTFYQVSWKYIFKYATRIRFCFPTTTLRICIYIYIVETSQLYL